MQKLEVEDTIFRANDRIYAREKLLDLSTPKVMGILNCTPDSFYAGSRTPSKETVLRNAQTMLQDGAAILDIGGYSTRPGADQVSTQEEMDRVCPAIEWIREEYPSALLSIDTFRSDVAETALERGADMINDISGFSLDAQLPEVAAKYKAAYVLMHMRGTPQTMQSLTDYSNIFTEMVAYFSKKLQVLKQAGVTDVILDPGFGFSKTLEDNYRLLKHLDYFDFLGQPLLAGISRKSMIYKKLGITPEASLEGTIALNAVGLSKGAAILRVHDVKEAVDLIRLLG